jgi:hypothetical protein
MDILHKYTQAINKELDSLDSMNRDWNPDQITQDILLQYHELLCNNEDTVYLCTAQIRTLVGKAIAKNIMIKDEDSNQLTIPFEGYDLIQKRYVVDVEGVKIAKTTINMTRDELNLIGDRMIKSGKTNIRHGKQIKEFALAKESVSILL